MSGSFIIPTKRNLRKRGRSMSPRSSVYKKSVEAAAAAAADGDSNKSERGRAEPDWSILVIGASGRTGSACIQRLLSEQQQPLEREPDAQQREESEVITAKPTKIHAFCRNPSKLLESHKKLCASVITGDARNPQYLQAALDVTKANVVILAVGSRSGDYHHHHNNNKTDATTVRTESAQALVRVLQDNASRFSNVRVIAVSDARVLDDNNNTVTSSSPKWALGMDSVLSLWTNSPRHLATKDHAGQEQVLLRTNQGIAQRCTLVRATTVTDDKSPDDNNNKTRVHLFRDHEKAPNNTLDRRDLVEWIVQEVYSARHQGQTINVTNVKNQPQPPPPPPALPPLPPQLRASLSLLSSSSSSSSSSPPKRIVVQQQH